MHALTRAHPQVPLEEDAAQAVALGDSGPGGGLQLTLGAPKHRIEKEQALVVVAGPAGAALTPAQGGVVLGGLQCVRVPLPCPDLPELVLSAVAAVTVGGGPLIDHCAGVWAGAAPASGSRARSWGVFDGEPTSCVCSGLAAR